MTGFDYLNLKVPLILGILIFMSILAFMLELSIKHSYNLGSAALNELVKIYWFGERNSMIHHLFS